MHLDDWTPDYWHPINEHILESLAKNADEEAKINAERAEAGYAARFQKITLFHFSKYFIFQKSGRFGEKRARSTKKRKSGWKNCSR